MFLSKELPDTLRVDQAFDIALYHSFSSPFFVFEALSGVRMVADQV